MKYLKRPVCSAVFLLLTTILVTSGAKAALSAPGVSSITAVTRHNNGDMFSASGDECNVDTCVGLSSGTAAPVRPDNGRSCTCRCLDHLPAYRDDLGICVDDIHECSLAPFVSGATSQQIPFVFLPLKGQIVHPSKEISFAGVKTPICAVSGAQFLTEGGWIELRSPIDNDVPFRLFRDEGRTFLQWLGDADLRSKMAGRLILIQMLCKDLAKDPTASDLRSVFTPCVAFRIAGTSSKYINNVSEVIFSPGAHVTTSGSSEGLTISEYVAIGICSILLGLIYVASVFLYLHIRRRRKKDDVDKDIERRDDQSLGPDEEGVVKNNPLLSLGRHFAGPDNTFSDSGSSDNDIAPDILQHKEEPKRKSNIQVTSAIIHPLNDNFSISLCQSEPLQVQDNTSIERLPEENVSIVETLEGREDRPETVKTIVSSTTRRKLYFNPAYFEPHLLVAPPPAAIEFLTKIREVISIAKQKMATKKFTPSLLGIPEEEFNFLSEPVQDFPAGAASSRRSSMISLKRENSRRRLQQCSGCPECQPHDLKTLCGKLPEFPSMAVCQSCSRSNSLVSESKQQSIRKWLEDVPILKPLPVVDNDEISVVEESSLHKPAEDLQSPSSSRRIKSSAKLSKLNLPCEEDYISRAESTKSLESNEDRLDFENVAKSVLGKNKQNSEFKGRDSASNTSKLADEILTSPKVKSRSGKPKAPPPPPLNQNTKVMFNAFKKSTKKCEEIKPNLSNQYDVIRNIRSSSPRYNLPPPDMINEAIVVDQCKDIACKDLSESRCKSENVQSSTAVPLTDAILSSISKDEDMPQVEEIPQATKEKMAAVINEFATHCGITEDKAKEPNKNISDYEADSLERSSKNINGFSTPTEYGDASSSQPSPSLSTALPMDEEMTMHNEILNIKTNSKTTDKRQDDDHEYELIVLKKQDKKPLLSALDKKLFNLPELLQRNNGYNLVSEVYVNNGYNFGSAPSTPTDSNSSTLENRKPKIRYEQPDEKPGHLTIEVEDCPDNYIKIDDSDDFEPDTLDRKSNKFKSTSSSDANSSCDYIDSLERPQHILLKTTGSFKSDTLNNASEIGNVLNSNFNRTFGSLREIYEARTKNCVRPGLDNISFVGPLHSPTNFQRAFSWNQCQDDEEGKLLTLEERQKRRQRSPNGSLRQIPPDVIPPSPIQSPIYEQPKPPRKVLKDDDFKPPLPPKNGNSRNTNTKTIFSDQTAEKSTLLPTKSTDCTGVSACKSKPSDDFISFKNKSFHVHDKNDNILSSFIHSDDIIFKNGVNNQFILHAATITPLSSITNPILCSTFTNQPTYDNFTDLSPTFTQDSKELELHLQDKNKSESVKKTWQKLVDVSSQQKEDSGYLSTDSNDSTKRKKEAEKESETDESLGDGHSESGAESIETHSVFFGTYRKLFRVTESVDSGVDSGSVKFREDIILLEEAHHDSNSDENESPS